MSDAFTQFEKRLESLERKHRELAKGYVAKINPDGLITVEPGTGRSVLKLRLFASLFLGLIVFKSVTLVMVGPMTYETRIESLAGGTLLERLSAWIMQADPVSTAIAKFVIANFG